MKKLTTQKKKTFANLRNFLLLMLIFIGLTGQGQNFDFTYSPITFYVGDTITFTNSSTGFPAGTVFKWSFGDCHLYAPMPAQNCQDSVFTQIGNEISYVYWNNGIYNIHLYAFTAQEEYITDTSFQIVLGYHKGNLQCNTLPVFNCEHVCNGNFEDLSQSPSGIGQLNKGYSWTNLASMNGIAVLGPSPDLFSANAGVVSTPNNFAGFQPPKSGTNYAGIIAYGFDALSVIPKNYYEYLIGKLAYPLQAGIEYSVEFYISKANDAPTSVDKIGAFIDKIYPDSVFPLNPLFHDSISFLLTKNNQTITPQIESPAGLLLTDTANWVKISGLYTAKGGEDGIYIGCFNDTNNFTISGAYPTGDKTAYYYIDDVSIKPNIPDTIEKVICLYDTITIDPVICDSANYYTYLWTSNPNDPTLAGQQTNPVITVVPLVNTTYTLSYTDTNNITDTVIVIVYVNSPPYILPIISGDRYICGNPGISVYKILNFNPNTVYTWDVNNPNPPPFPNLLTDSTFTVNWADYPNGGIVSIYFCDLETFEVFKCCDPFTPADSAIYFCNDTISTPTVFNNEKISICGRLFINADVTFNNSLIKLGQMSGIKVLSGYTLTINNDTFTSACNYMWDGIYAEDPTSSIIISNNSFFEHAKNAVVGANNANINITFSEFKDNFIGVKIRNYNPECEMVAWPDPPDPPPPANNTYIAGCIFHRSTASMPASLDPYYYNFTGVQIDTVYDITIGDYSSASLKNTFDNLVFGIKSINSELQVYNNEFNNISMTEAVPLIDNNNHPLEGAVYCLKVIYPAGTMPPSSSYLSCIRNKVIVGGFGLKKNVFDKCNFGVFTYKHSLTAVNNEFTEQYFNAVYDYLSLGTSHINNNVIEQHDGTWANNAVILNSAIRVESAFKSLAGKDLEILNNTINNTRTGIAVIDATSSLPGASNPRYAKIGSNMIYFDNFDHNSGHKHYGINIQDCDRIRVAGNHIKNNVDIPNFGGYPERLQGIHVAQSTGAYIYDNHRIAKTGYGIYAVGVCTNTQFSCNDLDTCLNGFYFEPQYVPPSGGGTVATFITQQGHENRASDNIWNTNLGDRIAGNLNITNYQEVPWYFRGIHDSQPYSPDVSNTFSANYIEEHPNTNVLSKCVGLPMPIADDDLDAAMRNQRLGAIVREEISYDILEDEFEDFNEEYLFEILYSDPELMYLGEDDDTAYINFYNYRVNSTIAEFIEIQELIDEGDINQALMDNGVVVAQTVIEVNKQVTNNVYLTALAEDIEFDQIQRNALFAIASLTPYIGGEGVYSARVMLGLDPDDLNLPYRKARPYEEGKIAIEGLYIYPNPTKDEITIELDNKILTGKAKLFIYSTTGNKVLEQEINTEQNIHTIKLIKLQPGIYFYNFIGNKNYKGKIVIID